ncbi:MAG: metallophosphoesterase family protein [Clostridiales bacterium]|nr:metallophosphoesterase family protein [Clostridiales bacterium]
MKKLSKSFICVLLAASLLFSFNAYADVSGAAESDEFTRICSSVNGDTENSVGISWCTTAADSSDVSVVSADAYSVGGFDKQVIYSGECKEFKGYYIHHVTVDKLSAGTSYYYRVGNASKSNWSRVCSFKTNAGFDSSFSFLVTADVQASSDENFERASKVMKAGLKVLPDPAFTVSLGDYVNDCTNDEWNWYFDRFSFANDAILHVPVAGNHDGNLKWNWFKNMFNVGEAEGSATTTGCYYSFDYGNAHIAVLNTNDMYPMSAQQLNWLRNDMNTSSADWKIIFMHRASYSAGKNIDKPDTIIMRKLLLPVIDELDIDLVMAGHDHMYFRTYQVKNDKVCDTKYVEELYDGEMTKFALNPEGTVHILPSTTGTKRYSVNKSAFGPILGCGEVVSDTKAYGVFSTVKIDKDKLVFKAYGYDDQAEDENTESVLIDEYAIKKDIGKNKPDPNYKVLPTNPLICLPVNIFNFVRLFTYYLVVLFVKIVPTAIKNKQF